MHLISSSDDDEDDAAIARNSKAIEDMLSSDESDDEEEISFPLMGSALEGMHERFQNPIPLQRGGSKLGRVYIDRDHMVGYQKLLHDYFDENCLYSEEQFKTRFRMTKPVFLFIYEKLCTHPAFQLQHDARNKPGIHPLVKFTFAIRFIAYGSAADALDEIFYISKDSAFNALKDACYALNMLFGEEYLRLPNKADMVRLLEEAEDRGWPGCMGSLDCTTWLWKNCPIKYVGQFIGKKAIHR